VREKARRSVLVGRQDVALLCEAGLPDDESGIRGFLEVANLSRRGWQRLGKSRRAGGVGDQRVAAERGTAIPALDRDL
jgi:hypothetical protein